MSSYSSRSASQLLAWPQDPSVYKTVAPLGLGGHAAVFKARNVVTDKWCAIKKICLEECNAERLDIISREMAFMSRCRHEHIVDYYCSFTAGEELWIVMELVDGGSLADVMRRMRAKKRWKGGPLLGEAVIATIFKHVLRGLTYLHETNLVHRDIKPDNILIRKDGVVKISDFGLSGFLHSPTALNNESEPKLFEMCGTVRYMAPEVFRRVGYTYSYDIWSLGMILLEMAGGCSPFTGLSPDTGRNYLATTLAPVLSPHHRQELSRPLCFSFEPASQMWTEDEDWSCYSYCSSTATSGGGLDCYTVLNERIDER